MTTYVDQPFYGWSHEELPHQDDSEEVSASQMLDHGSISFGRFAYESLSWEKRSVFTHNKCQEELEKFKLPGLVAKKKAYFEEYYKRIRAMKALQESQQTEITLDYGGDGSISSQTREEDETTVQLKNLGGEVADVDIVHLDLHSVEVSMEKGNDCSKSIEVQIEHSDTVVMSPDCDSFSNYFDEPEQEDKTSYPHQMQHLDMDTSAHESLTISIEDPKHDLEDLDNEGVSRENSISDTNVEPEVVSEEATSCMANSKAADVELKTTYSIVPKKVAPIIQKYKDNVSVAKLKEPHGLAKNGSKLEQTAKPNIQKPSPGSKYPIQKTTVKYGNSVGSSKATANKVSRNYKSASAASHGPLTEVHSNVTIPRPFSFATDKRAVTPSGSREGALRLISKPSNPKSPSAVKGKEAINVQGTSKRTVLTSSVKSKGLENKRGHEEKKKSVTLDRESTSHKVRGAVVTTSSMRSSGSEYKRGHEERKKPVTLNNQSTRLKARGANVLGPVRARSLNLPPRNKFSSNSGTDSRINNSTRDDRHKELILQGRHDARVAEFCRVNTEVITPSVAKLITDTKATIPSAAKLRTEVKKMAPSWMSDLSISVRGPRFGEQSSLDGKKPRQEKPRWR